MRHPVTKQTARDATVSPEGEKALASPYYLWDFCGVGPTVFI